MKLHVHNGPLPLIPPYFELDEPSPELRGAPVDLDELLRRLIDAERLRRTHVRAATSTVPYKPRIHH